jgi:hypothetical protein
MDYASRQKTIEMRETRLNLRNFQTLTRYVAFQNLIMAHDWSASVRSYTIQDFFRSPLSKTRHNNDAPISASTNGGLTGWCWEKRLDECRRYCCWARKKNQHEDCAGGTIAAVDKNNLDDRC